MAELSLESDHDFPARDRDDGARRQRPNPMIDQCLHGHTEYLIRDGYSSTCFRWLQLIRS